MIREATDEELGPQTRGYVLGVARHHLELIGELLHSGNKRQLAQLLEALPWRHALVLLDGIVLGLGHPPEMVGGELDTVGGKRTLTLEELVTLVEPIQGSRSHRR